MTKPLIASGTARGGTNLVDMVLSVHPAVCVVQDPYLPILKSFRNALVKRRGMAYVDLEAPLDEYYYFDERLAVMRTVQESDLNLSFDPKERGPLLESLARRMKFSSPRLITHLEQLRGATYAELFESALKVIGLGWQAQDVRWIGFNDNWAVEFFAPIARSFPEARFLIILRDVRACMASHLKLMEAVHSNPLYQYPKDRSLVALILSFARCWRKQIAFARHYQDHPLFKGRLHILTYEQLVWNPEPVARRMCDFLEVDYRPGMIETKNFVSPDGGPWLPNSNHGDVPQQGIFQNTVDRWKTALSREAIHLIEFVTGPDLKLAGYEVSEESEGPGLHWDAYTLHLKDSRECQGWRTDNRNAEIDFGLELLRRHCLQQRIRDPKLIERCFLFPEVYQSLVEFKPLLGN